MQNTGYDPAPSARRTHTRFKVFKGNVDFATALGLTLENVETLPRGASAHLPILVTAEYGQDSTPVQEPPAS